MRRIAGWLAAACVCLDAVAGVPDAAPEPSAEQIVERNVAARGGLEAWRRIVTMSWIGHVEAGTNTGSGFPFALEMKRPNKTRFVLNVPQHLSVRVFDGKSGWKLRMTDGEPPVLRPFSPGEVAFALDGQVIDGPLIDYQARGTRVEREGIDEIDGNKAYRIGVRLPSGAVHHVWIDAGSYLDIRDEHEFRNAYGRAGRVTKAYRNYQNVDGLQIPFLIESSVGAGRIANRMVIEKVVLNPPLDDRGFGKPSVPGQQQMLMTTGDASPRLTGRPRARGLAGLPARDGPNPGAPPGPADVR